MDTRPFLYLQKYSISPKTDLERWDWADLISIVSGETNIFITIFFFFLVPSLNSILFLFHFSLLLIFNDISSNFKESTPSATSMYSRFLIAEVEKLFHWRRILAVWWVIVVILRKPFLPNLPLNKRVSYDLSPFIEKNVMLIMKRVKLFLFFMWFRLMPLRKVRSSTVAYFC